MRKDQQKTVVRIRWRLSTGVSPPLLSHCTYSASNLKVVNLQIISWMASSHWNMFYSFQSSVTLIVSKICETSRSIRYSNLKWRFVFHKAVWDSLKPSQLIWLRACLPENNYRQKANSRDISQISQSPIQPYNSFDSFTGHYNFREASQ